MLLKMEDFDYEPEPEDLEQPEQPEEYAEDYNQITEELVIIGTEPIMYAIESNDINYLVWLIKNSAHIPNAALAAAVRAGNEDLVNYLIKSVAGTTPPANYFDVQLYSPDQANYYAPLDEAINLDSYDIINLLIKNGFTFSAITLAAAIRKRDKKLIDYVLTNTQNPAAVFNSTHYPSRNIENYMSPIREAIVLSDYALIELLIQYKFPVETNYLSYAVDNNDSKLFEFLVSAILNGAPATFDPVEKLPEFYDYTNSKGRNQMTQFLAQHQISSALAARSSSCDKDEAGNNIDPITGDVIPPERLVVLGKGTKEAYCFDLKTLYIQYRTSKKLLNPVTNTQLPEDIIKRIQVYEQEVKQPYRIIDHKTDEVITTGKIDADQDLGTLLLVYNETSPIREHCGRENLTNVHLILQFVSNTKSIYDFDLTTTLDTLAFDKVDTGIVARAETMHLTPEMNVYLATKYLRLFKYGEDRHIQWIQNFIPAEYQRDEKDLPPLDLPTKDKFDQMVKILYSPQPEEVMSAELNNYVVLDKPILLAEWAHHFTISLPAKIKDPTKIRYFQHLILSRVVDKFNLQSRGVERYYIRNRYQLPDYKILYN